LPAIFFFRFVVVFIEDFWWLRLNLFLSKPKRFRLHYLTTQNFQICFKKTQSHDSNQQIMALIF